MDGSLNKNLTKCEGYVVYRRVPRVGEGRRDEKAVTLLRQKVEDSEEVKLSSSSGSSLSSFSEIESSESESNLLEEPSSSDSSESESDVQVSDSSN